MQVAIAFIGTNKYFNFFENYYETISRNFLPNTKKNFFVFTDVSYESKNNIFVYPIEHRKWPYVTLLRFKSIISALSAIQKQDWFFFIDADMYANCVITEATFFCHTKILFGVQHPGYTDKMGTFEDNPDSCACVFPKEDKSTYWQGCFWGGKIEPITKLILELNRRIDVDLNKGIIAKWHDESHLNKYFIENKKDVYTYDAGYAAPEEHIKKGIYYDAKFIHLEKPQDLYPRFIGG